MPYKPNDDSFDPLFDLSIYPAAEEVLTGTQVRIGKS
jgi:hypothetical protein